MQAVVLSGGRGTRLGHLTDGVPKPMVTVAHRPFLEHELVLLAHHDITDVVLCLGYLGDQVLEYFGSGKALGMHLEYSWDGDRPLGPIGALKHAEPLLEPAFLTIYGDAYLRLDYQGLMDSLLASDRLGTMAVLHNHDRYGPSDLRVVDGVVEEYDKQHHRPDLDWVNFGVSALRRDALRLVRPDHFCDEETFYRALIARRQLGAFEVTNRFYEIGSPAGLEQFREYVAGSTHDH